MPNPVDAAPDLREPDAEPASDVVTAPDDAQSTGLVQEEHRDLAPAPDERDPDALATRPASTEPKVADTEEDVVAAEKEDRAAGDTAQQLGRRAVDGADATARAEADRAAEAVPIEEEAADATSKRDDVGAQAGSRAVKQEVITARPRPAREVPTGAAEPVVVEEAANARVPDVIDEDADIPGDAGRRGGPQPGEAEPVRVEADEDAAAADSQDAGVGDEPPAGNGGDDNSNRGPGGHGPEDGDEPADEEPEDSGDEPDAALTGRQPADAEVVSNDEQAGRDPVEALRAHHNLVGGVERLLDEAIANEDEGAKSATALELVTAQEEMERYIADQLAAGYLTDDQVAAVRGEPVEDVERDHGDANLAERTADTATSDEAGDDVDIDLSDHLHPEEPNEHDRVMTELRDRVEHANKMAERLTAARDAELIAGIPVDEWLVEAADAAAQEAHGYYNRNEAVLDDIELGSYDTTDGNVHFSINPAIPEAGDASADTAGNGRPVPPSDAPYHWPTGDTTADRHDDTRHSPPYWGTSNWPEGPPDTDPKRGGWDINVHDLDPDSGSSDTGSKQYEEVKALSGSVMGLIWDKLGTLHEKIVTNTENRTVERLRIVSGVTSVDLYKVSQVERQLTPSRYYMTTGHTGFRNGVFGGFRERKLVPLTNVSGTNVHAAKIIARQERRQQQLNNTHGSNGLRVLATAVRTAYGAKVDEHRARVIYRFEKSNFEYDHMRQRQQLSSQMNQTRYMRGSQREERRQEIRDDLRRLRQEEHRFRQHHKSVKSQNIQRRAARGTLRVSGKAIKGTAKGTAWAAKRSAAGTAKAARHTTKSAANRWAARQAGPGGTQRSPRAPGSKRSGRGPRHNTPPKAPNNAGDQHQTEDDLPY